MTKMLDGKVTGHLRLRINIGQQRSHVLAKGMEHE